MTRSIPGLTKVAFVAFASLAALALSVHAGAPPGRFALAPVADGALRLDTVTGAVSHCARTAGKWSCTSADDDMRTMHVEIDRLIEENRRLEAENARLRAASPPAAGDASRPGLALTLPSEADIDRGLEIMDRLMRKLQERFKGAERPRPPGPPL